MQEVQEAQVQSPRSLVGSHGVIKSRTQQKRLGALGMFTELTTVPQTVTILTEFLL